MMAVLLRLWAASASDFNQPISRTERDRIKENLEACQQHCERIQNLVMKLPLAGDGAHPAVHVVHV
jgi:hypothetical protein